MASAVIKRPRRRPRIPGSNPFSTIMLINASDFSPNCGTRYDGFANSNHPKRRAQSERFTGPGSIYELPSRATIAPSWPNASGAKIRPCTSTKRSRTTGSPLRCEKSFLINTTRSKALTIASIICVSWPEQLDRPLEWWSRRRRQAF